MMIIRDPPGAWIDIVVAFEGDFLARAAELGVGVAAAQRPATAAGFLAILQNFDIIACGSKLQCCDHARETRAEDQDFRAFRISIELDRAFV
jgi:hypothetical protein